MSLRDPSWSRPEVLTMIEPYDAEKVTPRQIASMLARRNLERVNRRRSQ
jgi:hypothetical protein